MPVAECRDRERVARGIASRQSAKRPWTGLNSQIAQPRLQHEEAERTLREPERGITSALPTVTEINALLHSFGFRGFRLTTAGEHANLYEIQRLDGSNAARTLSEGEKTFIAFLYFYHLIRGSQTTSGMTDDRVVAFDDPVSSLDSDVLFIVSSLIKRIFDLATSGQRLRQVFVLTHDIYFYKEVSFNPKRSATGCHREETIWIVKKKDDVSVVEAHASNPIKTSYDLLWAGVKDENRSRLTIQNTLRRILVSTKAFWQLFLIAKASARSIKSRPTPLPRACSASQRSSMCRVFQ